MQFAGCPNLHRFVLSPSSSCQKLTTLNLSGCDGLKYVVLQSASLQTVDLRNCSNLAKVRRLLTAAGWECTLVLAQVSIAS
jgi:hypothetical protein